MEVSLVRTMLDDIEQFSLLSSSNSVKSELIQRYCTKVDELLEYIKPVCNKIVSCEVASQEQLVKLLEELDAIVNGARELVGSWHPMMSKIYFVLQIEVIIKRFCTLTLELCGVVSSSLLSPKDGSIAECTEKIQHMRHELISTVIQEAVRNQKQRNTPGPEHLDKISNFLNLSSNQELLMEAVALEKVKVKVGRGESHVEVENVNDIITLVTYMHDSFVKVHQLQSINGVPIPADFCCPLSLQLMSDPVIVASGQTYERAFIEKWLDHGFNVCPKARQTLGHTNLIPNYTVKALIANWCESNNIKLSDPVKSMSFSLHPALVSQIDASANDHIATHSGHSSRAIHPRLPEPTRSMMTSELDSFASSGVHQEALPERPVSHNLPLSGTSPSPIDNGTEAKNAKLFIATTDGNKVSSLDEQHDKSSSKIFKQPSSESQSSEVNGRFVDHNRTGSASTAVSSNDYLQGSVDANISSRASSDLTHYSSDASGEVAQDGVASSLPQREPEFQPRLGDARPRGEVIWRRPSIPRIIPSHSTESRSDLSGVETQVYKLVEDLKSDSMDVQRAATAELRFFARNNMENRIVIANCGAISLLVGLLHSADSMTQENAVTALLNLSINGNNKTAIANANAIDPLIYVLETGSPEAKENSAATLFSLSVIEENKVRIGRSGAIRPLVDLLGNGTPRGKKDAATALFNLSTFHENKAQIVQVGAVKHLVELMDPAAGMVDKAVAVLANLATISEGRTAIGHAGGIPVLVEVVELGSARGKENAAAALLQLCTNSSRFCSLVLQEGAVPPLVALSQSGTPRAKEKAQALLSHFRNQRHGNAGRA